MNRLSLVAVFALCLGLDTTGATLYWDGADSSADADGGSGVWNTATPNWDDAATGGSATSWGNGSDAVFGGSAGAVTLGDTLSAGTVFFNVPGYEIATAGFDMTLSVLAGSGSFIKSGSGTLTITGQGSYPGNINVSGGMLKLGTGWNVLGAYNSAVDKVTVASGATLDVAGFWDVNFGLTLAGTGTAGQGAFINTGADTGDGHVQTPNIALSADATIGGSGNFYMIAPGYNPNTLSLNGHTLTKVGANTFCMVNTTVSAGSVYIAEGGFGVKISGASASGVAVTVANEASASLVLNNSWLDIGSLAGGGAAGGDVSLGSGDLHVGALHTSTVYAGVIRGTGQLIKHGSGALTLTGASTYTGATIVNSGRLNLTGSLASPVTVGSAARIAGTGSTTGSLTINGGSMLMLAGGATTAGLTANGVTFNGATTVWFEDGPIAGNVYDVICYGSGTVVNPGNLTVPYRGTLTDDTANHKLIFTATADGNVTRTWNTLTGTWDQGVTANWAEGDQMFYTGDQAVFGEIATDAVVTLSGNQFPGSVTVSNSSNQFTFGGSAIAGDTGLTKTGDGTLLLASANAYAGTTRANEGTIKIGNRYAFGSPWGGAPAGQVIVNPGGTVDFNGVIDTVYGYTIAGAGVGNAGALANTGSEIGNGVAQTSNIRLSSDASIGGTANWSLLTWGYGPTRLDLDGHTLTKTGANAIYLCNATLSTGTVRIASGTLSQTGPGIVDAMRTTFLLDDTAGVTLALNGNNLTIGALEGGGDAGARVAIDGATLTVGTLNTSNSFAGVISGWGTLVKAGTSTWVLSGKNNDFNGPVVVNGGTLKLGCGGPTSPNGYAVLGQAYFGLNKVTVEVGATLDLAGFENTWYGFTLAGTGTEGQGALVNTGVHMSFNNVQTPFIGLSADATIGGSGDFNMIGPGYSANALTLNEHTLTKAGPNTLFLVNTTVSTGTVNIAEGAIALYAAPADASAAAFTLANTAGVALSLNNQNMSVGSLAGGGAAGGQVSLGSGTLAVGALNAVTAYAGAISGSGALIKSGGGAQTFSGANTYIGTTTVSGGTLLVNGSHAGGTGYLVASSAAFGGTGTVTLASGNVDLQSDATLTPGSATGSGGTLTLSTLSMAPTAKLAIDNPADKVVVAGNLTLDNTLVTIANTNLFDQATSSAYPILTCDGSISGAFKIHIDETRWIVKRSGNTFYLRFNHPGTLLSLL